MNESQRSTEYIFQGTMYFFRREKILCRYQFALQDAVEPALLQRALEAALSAAPYYRVQLVQEKRSFFLEPNPNPCLVYQGSAQRDIPEETNGYLFSVSCEGDTVYFDWYHFLMDGHGVSPFLTRILEQYCNLRYGTAFANTPIVCSPAYDIEAMMEKYPCEAVRTNVLGTSIMADTALKYGVKKFIMISTDKAVNPSSVMGATKRLAEMYVQSLGSAIQEGNIIGKTSFITTRFGNVLGSNGSVIPLFRQQIMEGGPVTVTHPDIIRYFMTIPEACRLVLEAAFMGQGNDIFIFDMGKPVKITDMACRMIKLAGLQPDKDIEIVYTGLRPGEKLYEELLYNEENSTPTLNPKIFKGISLKQDYDKIKPALQQLVEVAQTDNKKETVYQLKQIVPEFKSMNSVYEALDEKTYISKKMKSNIMFN
jgi:nucleoside-diphosphate-sugar epimerase